MGRIWSQRCEAADQVRKRLYPITLDEIGTHIQIQTTNYNSEPLEKAEADVKYEATDSEKDSIAVKENTTSGDADLSEIKHQMM